MPENLGVSHAINYIARNFFRAVNFQPLFLLLASSVWVCKGQIRLNPEEAEQMNPENGEQLIERMLRIRDVISLSGLSRTQIYRLIANNNALNTPTNDHDFV